jgi:hypothetical protein
MLAEVARFTEHVDRFWADAFGIEHVHGESVRVVTHAPMFAGYVGIYVLRLGPTVLISAPPSHEAHANEIAGGRDVHDVASSLGWGVLGPSQHAYLHRGDHAAPAVPTTRPVSVEDLEPLRAVVPPEEWSEGGFGHDVDVVWGSFDGDDIVAAGNLTDFAGVPADIGLVTHPDHRCRGHGLRLTQDMCTEAFAQTDVVRYRALTTNNASLAVARRAGFEAYGENVALRNLTP